MPYDYLKSILEAYQKIGSANEEIDRTVKDCPMENLKPAGVQMVFSAMQFNKELRTLCAQYESSFVELEFALKD